jgi:hypothetical protein
MLKISGRLRQLVTVFGFCLGVAGSPTLVMADSNVTGSITRIISYTEAAVGAQVALVFVSPAMPSGTEGCTLAPANELWIDLSDLQGKTVYATLLSGYLAGQTLSFGVRGCAKSGLVPLVYSVQLGS